ncbi:TRAP transporter small permease [Salipiger mangrovisoli]|uniref:TRAP transporter small permease protein n=1 Tax=Salipiger mangrovisoli TaxID=2865933 RepID=A0ABR9XB13_9RHOB|nr:TRAP transporter small permease [Salipiger mangrovisoli]MBE9640703.1 TRAP transporter small permease [Salipiger mangrovisoli]
MKQKFARLSHIVAGGAGLVANLLLLAMLGAIGVQVVARFVIGAPTVWAEELARFLLVAITMIGSAALIEKNRHISIDVVVDTLPMGARIAVGWLRDAITLTVCGLLAHYGWLLVGIGGRQTSTGLGVKMSLPYLAIPIGAALIALVLVLSRLGRVSEDS